MTEDEGVAGSHASPDLQEILSISSLRQTAELGYSKEQAVQLCGKEHERMSEILIQCQDQHKRYGRKEARCGVNLRLESGKIVGLVRTKWIR